MFGDLFKLNEKISNKCVGLLQRARKYRWRLELELTVNLSLMFQVVAFPGRNSLARSGHKVVISLLRRNR